MLKVVPVPQITPDRANKLFTQFKAPYTSSECKILGVISKPLTFAGNSAFWGAVWGPVRNLHPLWQGKGAFLKLPWSTSASGYKHYKCCITMLQGRIWGRGTGKAGEWEVLTQGTQGKKAEKAVAPYLLRVSSQNFLSVAAKLYDFDKI